MSVETSKVLQKESGVSIDRMSIITGTNNIIELSLQLLEFNLYEDIFGSFVSATMLMEDALNMIEKLSLCGQEWMFIRVSKPGFLTETGKDMAFSILMRIYKITRVEVSSLFKQTYLIHLTKEEALNSARTRVNAAYAEARPEEAIKDIFVNQFYFQSDATFTSSFEVWPMPQSAKAFKFNIPNLHPTQAIQYLASIARGVNGINDYLFFESNQGYRFESLSNLMKADPVLDVKYRIKSIASSDSDTIDPYINSLSPIALENDTRFDYLNGLMQGEYGIQSDVFDLSSQTLVSNPITYDKFFELKDKLNTFPVVPATDWKEIYTKADLTKKIPYHRIFNVLPVAAGTNRPSDFERESLATRSMQFASLNNMKIRMQMPGTPLMKVGATISLVYPALEARGASDKKEELLDQYLSGKYLISSVRHVITRTEWNSYCELVTDSLPKELPNMFSASYTLEGL